ncbi:MAG: GNAT family N-acetyltransferase [Alphaproteobacteria bacterium]|nr:GNAT family N-acetyltransferase [Alphaproteobacteria bacterium]MCQ2571801.1 GNAT family N-acetyltransferase [Alphaproteobacteria bacterium]
MTLELVKPSQEYLPAFLKCVDDYRKDTAKYGMDSMRKLIQMLDDGEIDKWFVKKRNEDLGIDLPDGYVSGTTYWLMDNGEYIGSFTLRHALTDSLMKIGGNVGYVIAPSKRGQGYAFAGLKLVLIQAKKRGMDRVLITCNTKNDASFAVINKAKNLYGGEQLPDWQFDDFAEHRVWVNTI